MILVIPVFYITYTTLWKGDYSCVFRIIYVSLLRAFCGWFTYLPPHPTYLNSYYDFPDFIHCLTSNQDCTTNYNMDAADTITSTSNNDNNGGPEIMPFVSFFSGHVANMVIVANHMALSAVFSRRNNTNMKRWSVLIHILNVFQIVRLLATRGHYSIDIIIGWYMAVYVSNPAGRLGRSYSRGFDSIQDIVALPKTPYEAYERMIGISATKKERRMTALLSRPEIQEAIQRVEQKEEGSRSTITNTSAAAATARTSTSVVMSSSRGELHFDAHEEEIYSETTARLLQEAAAKILNEQALLLQEEIQLLQQQARHQYYSNKQAVTNALSSLADDEGNNDQDDSATEKKKDK